MQEHLPPPSSFSPHPMPASRVWLGPVPTWLRRTGPGVPLFFRVPLQPERSQPKPSLMDEELAEAGHGWPMVVALCSRKAQAETQVCSAPCSLQTPFAKVTGRLHCCGVTGGGHAHPCPMFKPHCTWVLLSCPVSQPRLPKPGTLKCFLPCPLFRPGGFCASLCALGPEAPPVVQSKGGHWWREKRRPFSIGPCLDSHARARFFFPSPELRPPEAPARGPVESLMPAVSCPHQPQMALTAWSSIPAICPPWSPVHPVQPPCHSLPEAGPGAPARFWAVGWAWPRNQGSSCLLLHFCKANPSPE